jgi:hypothetical protein
MFLADLTHSTQNWKQPKSHQQENWWKNYGLFSQWNVIHQQERINYWYTKWHRWNLSFLWGWGLNSRLQPCKAGTLLLEHISSPALVIFQLRSCVFAQASLDHDPLIYGSPTSTRHHTQLLLVEIESWQELFAPAGLILRSSWSPLPEYPGLQVWATVPGFESGFFHSGLCACKWQELYCLSHTSSPFCSSLFWRWVSWTLFLGLATTTISSLSLPSI